MESIDGCPVGKEVGGISIAILVYCSVTLLILVPPNPTFLMYLFAEGGIFASVSNIKMLGPIHECCKEYDNDHFRDLYPSIALCIHNYSTYGAPFKFLIPKICIYMRCVYHVYITPFCQKPN